MSMQVPFNSYLSVNGVNLSDHCVRVTLNYGAETRDITTFGQTFRIFRAGLSNLSVEAEFFNDHASGSVESTIRGLISSTSTGFTVIAQKIAASASVPTSTDNPKYTFTAIVDGDISLLGSEVGEVDRLTARFVPYAGTTTLVSTTATS